MLKPVVFRARLLVSISRVRNTSILFSNLGGIPGVLPPTSWSDTFISLYTCDPNFQAPTSTIKIFSRSNQTSLHSVQLEHCVKHFTVTASITAHFYRQPCVATQPIMFYVGLFIYYRQPCVATQPIMFYLCLFFFIYFFYSTLVLRNYRTDSHQIFRNCVFWCSLNNPVVLKFIWRHLAEKNAKNSENLVKISQVDSDFWQ